MDIAFVAGQTQMFFLQQFQPKGCIFDCSKVFTQQVSADIFLTA